MTRCFENSGGNFRVGIMLKRSGVRTGVLRASAPWVFVVMATLALSGCAGHGEIDPERTAGSIVMLGFETDRHYVSTLGYYYVLTFSDSEDRVERVVIRPRATDHFVIIDSLPPGDWTLVAYAARRAPGVDGFAGIPARDRPVMLDFPVLADSIQVLSQQLTIEHQQLRDGQIGTTPRMTPLTRPVSDRIDRRTDQMGEHWHRVPEPVGTIDEDRLPERRSFFDRLLGN